MIEGQKVTKKQMKAIFPKSVQDKVFDLMKRYRTRNVNLYNQPEGWEMYLAEGVRYEVYFKDEWSGVQMQSNHSLHAGNKKGLRIGERVPMPVGCWVVEFKLFLGKPFVKVHNVGLAALSA